MFWWDESLSTPAWVEIKTEGQKGDPGTAATVEVDGPSGILATTPRSRTPARPPTSSVGDPGKDGTGAGTVTKVKGGAGINSDEDSATPTLSVDLATNPGLETTPAGTGGKLKVKAHTGITVDNNGVSVTTPFSEPTGDNGNYLRKKDGTTFTWEKDSGGSGTLTSVEGGAGISVDSSTAATPKVSVDHDATLEFSGSGDSRQLKVKTPFVEPTGDDANYVRKKDGTTFTWEKESTSSGVPEPTSDGTFSRKKDGASLSWVAAEGFADVSTDGSFVRTRTSGGTPTWTAAPAASPWTRTPGTPNIISPAVAADTVNALGGPLLTAQVWAAAVSLSWGDGAPDFKRQLLCPEYRDDNHHRCAPSNLKVGQSASSISCRDSHSCWLEHCL